MIKNYRSARGSLPSKRAKKQVQDSNWNRKKEQIMAMRPISEEEKRGYENINYILSFLACADTVTLRNAKEAELQKLQRLLAEYYDDEIFDKEFPEKSIKGFQNEFGKPLSSATGDKVEYFRQRTLWFCAKKLYDMLLGSTFMKTMAASYAYGGKISEAYDDIYRTVVKIVHPIEEVSKPQRFSFGLAARNA